jgi:hypothetical protein
MIIIINGVGGSGKNTLIDLAKEQLPKPFKNCFSLAISSFAKEIMKNHFGWDGVSKTKIERNILSVLTDFGNEYGDLPMKKIVSFCKENNTEENLIFVEIRQIDKIKKMKNIFGEECKTICVTRYDSKGSIVKCSAKNYTDSLNYILDYNYDFYLNNVENKKEEMVEDFIFYLKNLYEKKEYKYAV